MGPLLIRAVPPSLPRLFSSLIAPACLLVILLACGTGRLVATPPTEYTLREWHEQDGLPSDEMTGVIQDEQGFLWVASSGGLARFDGTAFEPAEVPAGGFTRGITLVPGGGAAGKSSTLALPGTPPATRHEAGSYQLHDRTFRFEAETALAGKTVQVIFTAPDNSLWFGCEDGTVLRRNGAETRVFEPPADLGTKKITAFATDKDGQLWVQRGNRLGRIQDGQLIEIPFARPEPELRVASSATGGIWVFTRTTLLRWTGATLEEVLLLPDLRGAHFIQAALEDSHGYLWIGTRSQGLCRINGRDILSVPTSSENLVALCEDTEGNLWAATNGGGLSRLRAKAHQIIDQNNGLKDNFSYTVAEDATGTIWLANRDGGMVRYTNGVIDRVSTQPSWPTFSAMSVYPTTDGKVWMTGGLGVFRTEVAAPDKVERIVPLNQLRSVRATFVAQNGDYWLASDPDRIVRLRNDQATTFGPAEGFDGHEPRAFAEDAQGRLWVGAADGRLFRTNGDRFERVPFPEAETCRALQVIRFEPDGTILVGTTRQGVVVFPKGDMAHPRFLNSYHGMPGNNITQILHDDHDRTWFASRTGVFWIHDTHLREFTAGRSDSIHAVVLGKDDGLPYLSCLGLFQPAAWKAHDGTLWFASRRGILRTDPSLVDSNSSAPPAVTLATWKNWAPTA